MPDIFISKETKKEQPVKSLDSYKDENISPQAESVQKPEVLKDIKSKKIEKTLGHSHNPLAAYCYLPEEERVDFEDRQENEKVILFLRKHPVTNVGWILVAILMILAPLVLGHFPFLEFLPLRFQIVAVLGWYLVTMALVLENFLTWYFNVSIVTDRRIVDIDFVNLIYKQISDTTVDRIQDVTYKMGGVVRTIFNYGDVVVETAGEIPSFEFYAIPRPEMVTKVIEELMMKEEDEGVRSK